MCFQLIQMELLYNWLFEKIVSPLNVTPALKKLLLTILLSAPDWITKGEEICFE